MVTGSSVSQLSLQAFNLLVNARIEKQKAWFGVLTADIQSLSLLLLLVALKLLVHKSVLLALIYLKV